MASREKIENHCTLRIVREIASGGMGTVSEAIQEGAGGFEKRVAIKEILPQSDQDTTFIEMFIREAKLVADLVHENIVQIYQLSRVGARYYIVMEYVNGLSLADLIARHRGGELDRDDKVLPIELAVFICSRIAHGLAYAHSRTDRLGVPLKIVHRDVCPKNILITTEGLPKLGDFGIASAANMQSNSAGVPCIGKFGYMSPEQAKTADVDSRADIFSLGLVLFELLTLRKSRDKWKENLLIAAVNGWVDWDLLPRKLPRKLMVLLKMMLAEDPAKRYQNADKLAHDLELFIYGKGYGPTVVTLEKYLRDLAPELYERSHERVTPDRAQRPAPDATTVALPGNPPMA